MLRTLFFVFASAATGLAQMAVAPAPAASAGSRTAPKISYSSASTDAPCVALTFDDGPDAKNTPRLLDILAKRKIKVTFFVLGERIEMHPELLKREKAEGHEIGNHSFNHPNFAKMSDDAVRGQLQHTHDLILQSSGSKTKLMRPPYGSFTERQKKWVAEAMGYKTILWSVDPLDWKRPGPAVVARRIINEARPGAILLMHDIHTGSVDAVPQILDTLTAKGFKFVTVSELLALDGTAKPRPPKPASTVGKAGVKIPAQASSAAPTAAAPTQAPKTEPVPAVPATPAAPQTGAPATSAPASPVPPATGKKNDLPDSL